jgi:hypothetical protein
MKEYDKSILSPYVLSVYKYITLVSISVITVARTSILMSHNISAAAAVLSVYNMSCMCVVAWCQISMLYNFILLLSLLHAHVSYLFI